jgi:2-polyprenyl-3-methyl-5-hydroxy-6-metoxy-1,4-benzoquinol methylase
MSASDRSKWDAIYAESEGEPLPEPDPLLFMATPPGEPTLRALDLAGGWGQNALWLAEQGYTVDLMDVSRVALLRAQQEMAARHLRTINIFQADVDHITLQPETYHLVCVFRFLDAALMPQIRAAVRPGGRVIYETFNTHYLKSHPDFNPNYLLEPGELLGFFGDWRVLHHAELSTASQVVAIKPGIR